MRFIVLLWGEKSYLASDETQGVPIFSYNEIMELGRESRVALIDSHDASKLIKLDQILDHIFYLFISLSLSSLFDYVFHILFCVVLLFGCLKCKLNRN